MATSKTNSKTGHRKTNRAARTIPKPRTSQKKTKHGASRNKGQDEVPAVVDPDEKEDWEIEAITKEEVQNGQVASHTPGFKVHWRNTWIPAEKLSAELKNQFLARAEGVSAVINPQEGEDIEAVLEQKLENGKSYFEVRWRDTWVPKTEMTAPELIEQFREREARSQAANQAFGNDIVFPQGLTTVLASTSKDPSRAPSASQEVTQVVPPSGERSRSGSPPFTPAMSIMTSSPAENIATPESPTSLVRNGAAPVASAAPSASQGHPTPPPVVASATCDERSESNNHPLVPAIPRSPENTATPSPEAQAAGSEAASPGGSTSGAFLPSRSSSRLPLTPVVSAENVATPKPPTTSPDPKGAEAVPSVSQGDIPTVASAADSDTQQNSTAELDKLVFDSSLQSDPSEGKNKRRRSLSVASSEQDRPAKRTANMSQFRDKPSWEPYVRKTDAVEKNANDQLFVHLTWHSGDHELTQQRPTLPEFVTRVLRRISALPRFLTVFPRNFLSQPEAHTSF
ncbi:hypothetical protein R3P38DRAFT_2997293 [Favolaschia claudopus]|uniref:Chromo domain-containing protein n=1 Tax=Favolaschia claudopus TaxID=2862362 RepID=A0AAW0AR55_9AGAR